MKQVDHPSTLGSGQLDHESNDITCIDFAGLFQGRTYLLVCNAHSKCPEIIATTINRTIEELCKLFG